MPDSPFLKLRSLGFGSQRAIPGLDGLRALSIGLVLVAHLTGTRNFPNFTLLEKLGEFGVRVFFVISGYLITSILLDEMRRDGGISLSRFYLRRSMRLFPACYVLIAVAAILAAAHWHVLGPWDLVFAAGYAMNYHDARGWPLGHLWSLAVEEQFYLVWPLTLRMFGPVRARRALIGIIAIVPFLRLASLALAPALNFVVWSDALATGCLLALLRSDLSQGRMYRRILASRWFILVPAAAFAALYTPSTKVYWLVSETVMNVAIAVSMDWAMRNSDSLIGRVLNFPAVSFMGVLSYSLYLWQQMFLNRYSNSPLCAFPLNIVLAVTLAMLSYLLVEVPFLRLRAAIERSRRRRTLPRVLAHEVSGD